VGVDEGTHIGLKRQLGVVQSQVHVVVVPQRAPLLTAAGKKAPEWYALDRPVTR
jgi:hypothetical protein